MTRKGQTYEAREKKGRVPLNAWLSADAAACLDGLIEAGFGATKRQVIERLLLEADISDLAPHHEKPPPPVEDALSGVSGPAPAPDSPAALAARVRAKGARREAVEVRTGKRVAEGRTTR